jgi:hypothetical protein
MSIRENKLSIVFLHGLWADGSCLSKLIPTLRAEGHEVIAVQYGSKAERISPAAWRRARR